ncbi:MAG: fenitrothion hydrolase [Solirubrobacterales bacterium]|nr:fenitrothion hydrolase [Solirubrobacterales bacterium]
MGRRSHRPSKLRTGAALAAPVLTLAALSALALPDAASAHALVGRRDLPIPAWLFAWGASVALIVSFVILTTAWRTPRFQRDTWRSVSRGVSAALINPVTEYLAGLIGVGLTCFTVYAGLKGTADLLHNWSIVFVFVTFWLGVVMLSVLFGDVLKAFNPWRAVGRAASGGFRMIAGQRAPAPLSYPERLGYWPAMTGLIAFVWLELVYGNSLLSVGSSPHTLAVATIVYSAITFVGMALYGVERWIERGETFSVYFRMFSRLAAIDVRDGRLGVRRPLTGAPPWGAEAGAVGVVLVSIGLTSFDGAQEGLLSSPIASVFEWVQDLSLGQVAALRITESLFMVGVLAFVAAIFLIAIKGMHAVKGSPPARELAHSFAHSLIPIALAYLVAHYFSLFVFQEQAQFTYLLSDPLGDGSDLFGTASGGIDYALLGANVVWYVQVAALVIGHVTGLTLAHDKALTIYTDPKLAARSQYPMLAAMVTFTCLGLYLLSQSNA